MDNIGKILQQARKKKKYTLEKIHKMTKIKEAYIIGLENSDISAFPAEIYYKNFLKTYSKFLGLNPDEIAAMYEQYKLERAQDLFREDVITEQKAGSFKIKLAITIALFILISAFLFLLSTNTSSDESRLINADTVETAPAAEPSKNNVSQNDKQTLRIEAVENSWIKVIADNEPVFQGFIEAGKKYEAEAYNVFEIKIGNVKGVTVYFNNKKADILTGADKNNVNNITLKKN